LVHRWTSWQDTTVSCFRLFWLICLPAHRAVWIIVASPWQPVMSQCWFKDDKNGQNASVGFLAGKVLMALV
jgi:hypothetical protein